MLRALWVLGLVSVFVACGDDESSTSSGGGGAGGTAAIGATGGSTGGALGGGTGGAAGTSGGSAGATGGSAGATGGSAGATGGSAGATGGSAGADGGAIDAGADAGVPLPGLGALGGDCGPIDSTEILSASPYTFDTALDFGTSGYDYNALSPGGKKVFDDGNLGGSSIYSEIFSYEVLYRCELAKLLKTETEVYYKDSAGKKTDLLVEIDGFKLGVSVTRAFAYPPGTLYTTAMAQSLLDKKLTDILASTQNVAAADAWKKQILHILAYDTQHRDALAQAYPQLPTSTRADTIVMVTVTNGNDAFMY